ncbi:MAG TPA: hypothetical protein VFW28_11850 [Micropepsaceae bacterium]|nr:hypothetical protein [Micropepsaceae bacterium]
MRSSRLFTALLLASSMIAAPAMARHHHHVAVNTATSANAANASTNANGVNAMSTNAANANTANAGNSNELAIADGLMRNSQGIISQMQSDSNVANLMRSSKAVFVMPNSSTTCTDGSAGCGGGVMLINNNGRWSNPVFFTVGSGSTTAQRGANNSSANNAGVNTTGAGSGPVALLIMSNRALNQFRSGGNISLNGKRRLNVVNYRSSPNTQPSSLQRSDLIVWSGSTGNMLPSLLIRANRAFDQTIYGTNNQHRIVAGRAPLTNQLAVNLANQMPQGPAPTQLGSNQPGTTTRNGTQPG